MEARLKVLFIASGNSKFFEISPFIKAQGESLIKSSVDIKYFNIIGKGIWGYLENVLRLRKFLKQNPVDIIHAHYTLSGWVAILSFPKRPIVLSLMGSDAYGDYISHNRIKFISKYLIFLTFLIQPFVKSIICKSKNIESFVYFKKKAHVLPNGINLKKILHNENGFREELGISTENKYILFLGNKTNKRKNYNLVEAAFKMINEKDIILLSPYPLKQDEVVKYLNSVDVLVVTSFMEGSSNIIKEAMACNCPIVSTNIGDVEWIFGETEGCYLASFDLADVAEKIKMALKFAEEKGRTKGRERIITLGLDSDTVAKHLISIYESVIING